MELLGTAKTVATNGENIECSVFMLRDWKVQPGTIVEQRRVADNEEEVLVATWTLVEQTNKSLILRGDAAIEMADRFYVEPPTVAVAAPVAAPTTPVLVFGGKNWKLASPKKWKPAAIAVAGCPSVGELNIDGKEYVVLKLDEGFAARLKAAS